MNDKIDILFAEFQNLKMERKIRRMEFAGPDNVFYNLATEIAVSHRLEDLRSQIEIEIKK